MRKTNLTLLIEKWEQKAIRVSPVRLSLIAILSLWLGNPTPMQAQEVQLGIDFSTVFPLGEFKQNIDNNGYGLGGQFAVRIRRSPILIGADAGFVNYGSEERREPLSPNIPDVELKVRTNNNIVWTHFMLRAQPRTGSVRPYLDGLVGFKYLFTDTQVTDEFDSETIASTKNFSDLTLSYGFGGGVQVRLADIGRGGSRQILLDSKVRYLRGSRAEYLKKGSIRRENGTVFFDVLSSRTDVLALQVGVTFRF
jgi:opacity protein-like surface antigen